jgi:uncharacterized membrane protein YphA (DoxX/SURF4 family)
MLSVFPFLFNFEYLAPLILRVAVGLILIAVGFKKSLMPAPWKDRLFFVLQTVVGVFMLAGFLVQPSALAGIIVSVLWKLKDRDQDIKTILLLIASFLALLLMGPGMLAIDLPL